MIKRTFNLEENNEWFHDAGTNGYPPQRKKNWISPLPLYINSRYLNNIKCGNRKRKTQETTMHNLVWEKTLINRAENQMLWKNKQNIWIHKLLHGKS